MASRIDGTMVATEGMYMLVTARGGTPFRRQWEILTPSDVNPLD